MSKNIFALALTFITTLHPAHAAIFEFDIIGKATPGLSGLNENGNSSSPATGMELSPGISYDDSTHQLTLHFGWGSDPAAGGGTDLTGDFLVAYIQGPANPDGTTSGGLL